MERRFWLVLLYADGSFYKKSLTLTDKVNGTAEYVLSNEELKHYGQVKAELKLYYTNGQALATTFFTFSIAKTLEDQNIVPVADYYIDDFETLRAGVNATVVEISQTIEELRAKFADLEAIETKEGAQEKVDAAENSAISYTDKQAEDAERHITAKERAAWNGKETPIGSQEKVDAHANKTDIHVTQADKNSWNEIVRQFTAHNYNQDRHISAAERTKWNGAITYANIMLKNGAAAGTRTPMYAKWGPFLIFRGHVKTEPEIIFGSIPSAYVPAGGAVVSIALSGTGGTANLIVYENGDLKIKYPNPADSSKLPGGYYIDVPIGFQEGGTI
ncbi:BppU family phage baseplate upper protein [Bacillus atrophaeus]